MQIFTLNREHEVEYEEKEIPDEIERNAQQTETLSHSLVLCDKFNLIEHYEKRNHDKHGCQERVIGYIFHISVKLLRLQPDRYPFG